MNSALKPVSSSVPSNKVGGYPLAPDTAPSAQKPASVAASPAKGTRHLSPREFGYRLNGKILCGDTVIAFVAILAGLTFREGQRLGWTELAGNRAAIAPGLLAWALGGSLVFTWIMLMLRSYDVKNLYRLPLVLKKLAKASVLWAIGVWACVGLFSIQTFSPRLGALYCMGTLIVGVGMWRTLAFVYLINPRVKQSISARTIVIGWTDQAAHLREAMRMDYSQLAEIIGCVPMPGGRFSDRPPQDLAVLGDYSALPQIVEKCGATSLILADLSCSSAEILHLVAFCQRELIKFQLVPQYFPALHAGLQVQSVSGVPLLGVHQLPLNRTLNRTLKRSIDIVGALMGLGVSALIVPFFCLIVYLESPGPVIFRQRRTSRAGRDFYIYKIRSMRLNAESGTGAVWCKQEDSRRLKVGALMRKTNIDELPQFWNVLIGDMSLVGPRPERPELIEKFKYEIPNYNVRHEVRTGLTGWAQINGLRGDTDLTKRIEADIYYMENWSLFLDLYCIFATVFKRKNAY